MNTISLLNIFGAIILCAALTIPAHAEDSLPNYKLSVSFDLAENLVRGDALISLPADREWTVHTEDMKILKASFDGTSLDAEAVNEKHEITVERGGLLELSYEKVFGEAETDIENVGVVGSVVSSEGISLTGMWYPQVEDLFYHSLTALVPEGFTAVSEADMITEKETPEGREFSFHFPHPSEGMTLAASNYVVSRDVEGDVEVYAYFFEEDASLAREYIDYTKRYLRMYDEMLGAYPYKRFSVVENFLPTGYSMPTYTLLGREVVRLPFIVKTSLGHEILHQWFGNSVYGDPEDGNWLEGITNYLADQYYKVLEGEGALYRKKILMDYQSYVTPDKEIPLEDFKGRVDPATKAVGYGKGAMLFHMLKNLVGEEVFNNTLKKFVADNTFKRTSWLEIREVFESTTGMDLGKFFTQWLTRADVPDLEIKEQRVLYVEGVPNVEFKLRQKGEPYALRITVKVITDKGEYIEVLDTDEEEISFNMPVEGSPRLMALDPDYAIMRALWPDEFPPTISRLLGDENRFVVVPEEGVDDYLPLVSLLRGEGFNVKLDDDIKDEDLISSSVLLLGPDGPVHRRLFAKSPVGDIDDGFMITMLKNPLNPDKKVLAIAVASGREEVEASARKIFHYGNYSRLKFIGGRNVEKDIAKSDAGMMVNIEFKVSGVKPQSAISLEKIIEDIIKRDIIYVGESHTNYEDHRVQLDVIRALKERGGKFAIGMEMFQRPFQKALDDYIAGETTEKEFLKASEYFKRWMFNYHLYREILQYARAHEIPVVALNIDSDIVDKVSSGGLDALSEEERGKIPEDMDMSNMVYRRKLKEIFGLHRDSDKKFENFYQSQIIWDETMAHSVNRYLSENPNSQMVVLAGMGHVAWGYGIPDRTYRLNGKDYAILINSNVDTIEEGMADYVLFPEMLKAPESPKLGVMVSKTEKGLEITEVQPGSAAADSKIKKGDIITSVDGFGVQDLSDIKIALFEHKAGDTIEIKVLRKRFLAKRKENAIPVELK